MSTREMISKHTNCAWLLADGQVRSPPGVTLYLWYTSTLAQCYLNFGDLHSSVASHTFFFEVNQDVMRNQVIYIWYSMLYLLDYVSADKFTFFFFIVLFLWQICIYLLSCYLKTRPYAAITNTEIPPRGKFPYREVRFQKYLFFKRPESRQP